MHVPQNNPMGQPTTGGKSRRYVQRTSVVRAMRLDRRTDNDLLLIQSTLSNPNDPQDQVSCSMITRVALQDYAAKIAKAKEHPLPYWLEAERATVRGQGATPPRPRRSYIRGPYKKRPRAPKVVFN